MLDLYALCLGCLAVSCERNRKDNPQNVAQEQSTAKAKFLLLKLLQLFARDVLLMKKLEIEKTKPTFIISTFKTDIIKGGLVFSIFELNAAVL